MPFTIPDQGEGASNLQSILWQEELEVLVAGLSGIDCVLFGLDVTGGADMTPAVAKGAVLSNRTMFAVAAADVTITAADATNPRLDLIVVTSAGALAVRAGTPAEFVEGTSAPKPPARTANDVVIAIVYVPANDTAIATTQIIDKRIFATRPVTIFKDTTSTVTNNSAVAIEALNKAGAGVSIPSGLFTTGSIIRTRIGGNLLVNSATATVRFAILFGGTVMFNDISPNSVNDADRRPFVMEFNIAANNNTAQNMVGLAQITDITLATAPPTTGIGELWGAASTIEGPTAFGGASAVDATSANRLISVQVTFNAASTSLELVSNYATMELVA
jgi:hypothetical protein